MPSTPQRVARRSSSSRSAAAASNRLCSNRSQPRANSVNVSQTTPGISPPTPLDLRSLGDVQLPARDEHAREHGLQRRLGEPQPAEASDAERLLDVRLGRDEVAQPGATALFIHHAATSSAARAHAR